MSLEASEMQSGAIGALEKLLATLPPVPPKPRNWCDWCKGKGCIACAAKRRALDEEYKRQFPNGLQPIFTAHFDNPEEMASLKKVLHREVLEREFGPGGGGIEEIERLAAVENERLAKLKEKK